LFGREFDSRQLHLVIKQKRPTQHEGLAFFLDKNPKLASGFLSEKKGPAAKRAGWHWSADPLHTGPVKENFSCAAASRVPEAREGFHSRLFGGSGDGVECRRHANCVQVTAIFTT